MAKKEEIYKRKVKKRLEAKGYLVHCTREMFTAGWPDIVAVGREGVLFIELKVGSNKLTALQDDTLKKLAQRGAWALTMCLAGGVESIQSFSSHMPNNDTAEYNNKLIAVLKELAHDEI